MARNGDLDERIEELRVAVIKLQIREIVHRRCVEECISALANLGGGGETAVQRMRDELLSLARNSDLPSGIEAEMIEEINASFDAIQRRLVPWPHAVQQPSAH